MEEKDEGNSVWMVSGVWVRVSGVWVRVSGVWVRVSGVG